MWLDFADNTRTAEALLASEAGGIRGGQKLSLPSGDLQWNRETDYIKLPPKGIITYGSVLGRRGTSCFESIKQGPGLVQGTWKCFPKEGTFQERLEIWVSEHQTRRARWELMCSQRSELNGLFRESRTAVGGRVRCLDPLFPPVAGSIYFSSLMRSCNTSHQKQVNVELSLMLWSGCSLFWKTGRWPASVQKLEAHRAQLLLFWKFPPHWELEWQLLPWRLCPCQAQFCLEPRTPKKSRHKTGTIFKEKKKKKDNPRMESGWMGVQCYQFERDLCFLFQCFKICKPVLHLSLFHFIATHHLPFVGDEAILGRN